MWLSILVCLDKRLSLWLFWAPFHHFKEIVKSVSGWGLGNPLMIIASLHLMTTSSTLALEARLQGRLSGVCSLAIGMVESCLHWCPIHKGPLGAIISNFSFPVAFRLKSFILLNKCILKTFVLWGSAQGCLNILIGHGDLSKEAISLVKISECQRIKGYFKVLMISSLI